MEALEWIIQFAAWPVGLTTIAQCSGLWESVLSPVPCVAIPISELLVHNDNSNSRGKLAHRNSHARLQTSASVVVTTMSCSGRATGRHSVAQPYSALTDTGPPLGSFSGYSRYSRVCPGSSGVRKIHGRRLTCTVRVITVF